MKKIRLDKFLAKAGLGTRTEVKKHIAKGLVKVNEVVIRKPETKVSETEDLIQYQNKIYNYSEHTYIMLHKPAGVITATEDKRDQTVMDLIQHPRKGKMFPVGRLDKDTEGLLLITDDGELAHQLLSPKKHVDKTYYAKITDDITAEHINMFKKGLILEDGYECLPAVLEKYNNDREVLITIQEGKFHQIKRMVQVIGMEVQYLKRLSMGPLKLDINLDKGESRFLTEEEIQCLKTSRQ